MSQYLLRWKKHRAAASQVQELVKEPKNLRSIHYSCESFYDRPQGASPRVTSIAVRHHSSGQTVSFSIHQMAEREGCAADQIATQYDDLERKMLHEFYEYVKKNQHCKWIHWNMRDSNYGFQALAHRFKVLKGEPVDFAEENLVDLARVMVDLYSENYIGHPRLEKLVKLNGLSDKGFISGAEEAAAFEKKDFVRLHQSTLRKVDIFESLVDRLGSTNLKTEAGFWDKYGLHPGVIPELVKEHWIVSGLTFLVAIGGTIGSAYGYFEKVKSWLRP